MAEYSMASLGGGDESMAGIDDSAYKLGKGGSGDGNDPTEMLGDLKRELGMTEMGNPQGSDSAFIGKNQVSGPTKYYGTTEVFDEKDEEYDSESDEDSGRASTKRRSLKKPLDEASSPTNKQKTNKLMNLVKQGLHGVVAKKSNNYKADDAIDERTSTQENESPSDRHSITGSHQDVSSSSYRNDS